ncbi:MAG: ElyC/SanA/YdcF family protein [Coriobacteriia bacterium]|nr:ElyC/SanA/YdcF family protein [Coriobacteriia bacterium]
MAAFVSWLLVAFLACVALIYAADSKVVQVSEPHIFTQNEVSQKRAEAIVVLGAKVHADGRPSLMLKDRLDAAANLYEQGVSDRIICSGDHGQTSYDETGNMKAYLIAQGIPADHIFEDHAGFSTYETVYRADAIFGAQKLAYVSQEYHLFRTLYVAQMLGQTQSFGVICDTRLYEGQSYRDAREVVARTKDFLQVKFGGTPTYLGDPIDLRGSGSQTDD